MKSIIGKVISDKMKDTVVVETNWSVSHPTYQKLMRRASRYHAHNSVGAKLGDTVRMTEVKPISKTKTWNVEEVIVADAIVKGAK